MTSGDCSNIVTPMEVLKLRGINAIPFSYPELPNPQQMQQALRSLVAIFGTTLNDAGIIRDELQPVRELAWKLDELTWKENKVSGYENHLWLVPASDFDQDYRRYLKELQKLCAVCSLRVPSPTGQLRLAYIGVPSVYAHDLYRHVEQNGSRVVFNEIQRQFAMPKPGESLANQYSNYTYPYSIHERLEHIKTELSRRQVDGIIHYIRAFCHRVIVNIVFRTAIDLSVLTLEGNDDFPLSNHIKTQI